MTTTLSQLDLPGVTKLASGKVREIFDLGHQLLFVASDRISAFDVIMPNPIPGKGQVLTAFSEFWFGQTTAIVANHLVSSDLIGQAAHLPAAVARQAQRLQGRSMIVRKCQPLAIECVVRGYLAGSGWKEYRQNQSVCGNALPAGLKESSELPEPIFTPATKATSGHDINIDFAAAAQIVGDDTARQARDYSIALYQFARDYARNRGIIIADTKFEFGHTDAGELILIDEALTPDSSRFWPADQFQPGRPQPSFDKQFLRDYLETLDWNKQPPGPELPAEIIRQTAAKYQEALARLTTA